MPALWPKNYNTEQQSPLPDCVALVKRAARYKRQRSSKDYERCMQALQAFFVCDDAAPARTPADVMGSI